MIKEIVKAYNQDSDGKATIYVGEQEVDRPESLEDLKKLTTEDKIVSMWWGAKKIEVRAQIKSRAKSGKPSDKAQLNAIIAAAKKQRAEGDSSAYDSLVRLGIIAS